MKNLKRSKNMMDAEQRYKFHRVARYLLAVPIVFLLDWWVASLIFGGSAFCGRAKDCRFCGDICDFGLRAALVSAQKV